MWWFKRVFLLLAVVSSAACGFQPLYGGGKNGPVAGELAEIKISPIADRLGQQLRNELLDLLTPYGQPAHPKYRITISLTESKSELAVKKSEAATRANMTVNADFRLIDFRTGAEVFKGTSSLVGSYNILSNDYATLAAERSAKERIVKQVALDIQTRLSAFFKLRARPADETPAP